MARTHSESLQIARAGEDRTRANEQRVSSQRLPQLNFGGTYTRTLASEFSGAFDNVGPVCNPLAVDPSQPVASRVSELERAASCGALSPGFSLGNLPFGQRNIYQLAFTFSQTGPLGRPRS